MSASSQTLPVEQRVMCACDHVFHLPLVLLLSPDSEPAHACVRCGRITCTEVLWTYVHHNTYEAHGRREYLITEETQAWLDRWPRVLRGAGLEDYAFLPSTARCTDVADFQRQAAQAFATSKFLPRGRRLREAGIPIAAAPACLPDRLENYRTLWELCHELTPARDGAFLLKCARPVYRLASALAIDALLQRADLAELLAVAAASPEHEDRAAVCDIVRDAPAALPLALPGLLRWLEQAVDRGGANLADHRVSSLLDFLAAQKTAAAQIVPSLTALQARVRRPDFEFSRLLTNALRALSGEPPLPISSRPWFFDA